MKKAEEKVLGISIVIKYVGYAILGLSLVVIVLASLLGFSLPYTTEAILFGIFLIAIGYVAEIIFTQGSA